MNRRPTYDQRRGAPVESAVKMPHDNEIIGRVIKIAGASKFMVRCTDGNERLCSIPGRLRRRFWIKEGDLVIVKPWVVQSNERGDIIWRYSVMDMGKLKDMGKMQNL